MSLRAPFSPFFVAVSLFVLAAAAHASTDGSDNASNYSSNWYNGSNGGTGFGPWAFSNNASATNGEFIGDSTYVGNGSANSGANINNNGVSFGMYANGGTNPYADATRSFAGGALTGGQDFSCDVAVNYRNGGKGIDIEDASGNKIFTFNTTGDDYVVSNAATGDGSIGNTYSSNTAFHLDFSQTSASGGTWTITRSGGVTGLESGSYTGDAAAFNLFVYGTSNDTQSDFYSNNFTISGVPEPSTWLAGSLVCGVVGFRLRAARRRGMLPGA